MGLSTQPSWQNAGWSFREPWATGVCSRFKYRQNWGGAQAFLITWPSSKFLILVNLSLGCVMWSQALNTVVVEKIKSDSWMVILQTPGCSLIIEGNYLICCV